MAELSDLAFDERTALVVVDVQNDFVDPRGNLYVKGAEETIPLINRLIADARSAGALVVYTQDWHPAETPHFRDQGGIWPVHCVGGTWGAELHPELDVDGPIVRKGTGGEDGYSGFTARDVTTGEHKQTALERTLRDRGIEKVVVVGHARDVCVMETALDARRLGFDTHVVLEATRPVDTGEKGRESLEQMVSVGVALH
ncbi:MAG TPA: isochorismatase family protein [Acidimicrobiales bacterium]